MNDKHKTSRPNGEQRSNSSHRPCCLGVRLAMWCALGLGLAAPSRSLAQPFRIDSSQLGPEHQPSFSVPPDTNAYYRLLEGEQTTNFQTVPRALVPVWTGPMKL
ncbi:MAG: hypothetical protein ACREIC_01485 [Limisphaerales bacterium]